MSENNKNIDPIDLCIRYFSGEASPDEIKGLETWVQENETNRNFFQEYKKTWQLSASRSLEFDKEEAWKNVSSKIKETHSEKKVVQMKPPSAGMNSLFRIAAIAIVFLTAGFLVYTMFFSTRTTELVANNDILQELLNDGSEVTLNKNSSLIYDSKFNKKERKVTLTGSAFFNVARNETKPFVVETPDVHVKVLGTSFYINSQTHDSKVEVTVNSGVVRVTTAGEQSLELVAGEKAVLNKKSGMLQLEKNTNKNFLSWKTKTLVFENTPFEEVIEAIEATYGVEINVANSYLLDCQLTATYTNFSREDVLHLISETLNLKITGSGDQYLVDGEGCD